VLKGRRGAAHHTCMLPCLPTTRMAMMRTHTDEAARCRSGCVDNPRGSSRGAPAAGEQSAVYCDQGGGTASQAP